MEIGIGIGKQQLRRILVNDTFNRADNASSIGNADTGQAWQISTGVWGIQNNAAYVSDTTAGANATINANTANIILTCKFTWATNNYQDLLFRRSDMNNSLLVEMISGTIRIQKIVSGSFTTIGSVSTTTTNGQSYAIKVIAAGSKINFYVDGVLKVSVTETFNQTATIVGMRSGATATGCKWDNFTVEAL